jgi:diaminopimelate decarboxylase
VSESGVLLVQANVVKQTLSTVFVGVNSGQNHLLRPKLYDAYHHIVNLSNTKGGKRIYSVVGYICETDTLGYDRKLNEVKEGDILAIMNAGAYGFTMSSNYNSRTRPAEVLIINQQAKLIRERETLEDQLKHQIDLGI